jgi:hypothetical protein
MRTTKLTDGANDRPKTASIAQTAQGIPDEGESDIDVSDDEVERVRQKLMGNDARQSLKAEIKDAIDLPQKGSA